MSILQSNSVESYHLAELVVHQRTATASRRRMSSSRLWAKELIDRSAALVGLIITAPVLLLLFLLVRLTSRGPAIYAQLRVGRRGQLFHLYKIRSMYHNCERGTGPVWASTNDNRVTPLGKILRATYLDELPQLFNVLKGDMSLVGPRPERPEIMARLRRQFPHDYYGRVLVKPGITGLAQIHQAADIDVDDVRRKLHYDLLYVRRACVWLDLKTIFGTVWMIVTPRKRRTAKSRVRAEQVADVAPISCQESEPEASWSCG